MTVKSCGGRLWRSSSARRQIGVSRGRIRRPSRAEQSGAGVTAGPSKPAPLPPLQDTVACTYKELARMVFAKKKNLLKEVGWGLYMDMNLFLRFGREHVPWNFEKTENHVYLHVVQWQKPDADEPERLKPLCSPLALSVGSDSNGSGVVALLEIARIFSHLYSSPKTRSKFNLLFGLTSGGPYG